MYWGHDASEDPDADNHDYEPEVEEVHERGGPGGCGEDMNHELGDMSRVGVQHGVYGQRLFGIQTHFVTDGLKSFLEFHKIGQVWSSRGGRARSGLINFTRRLTFDEGEFLGVGRLHGGVEDGLDESRSR